LPPIPVSGSDEDEDGNQVSSNGQEQVSSPIQGENLDNIRNTNSSGESYPSVIDPRTGNEIPMPEGDLEIVPREERVEWSNMTRAEYIAEWHERGFPEPEGGW